ncbi:RNA-dependent RNA polymerase [Trichinella nativa]|uniref:RNA-dependent RNA polymerase n=1 Tax=Trichinella nativa TaxID=6335 RepID=A0A1Y3EU96_9BILA|nr:RNA-dependent RNA polymerase [Trichinella nativa]
MSDVSDYFGEFHASVYIAKEVSGNSGLFDKVKNFVSSVCKPLSLHFSIRPCLAQENPDLFTEKFHTSISSDWEDLEKYHDSVSEIIKRWCSTIRGNLHEQPLLELIQDATFPFQLIPLHKYNLQGKLSFGFMLNFGIFTEHCVVDLSGSWTAKAIFEHDRRYFSITIFRQFSKNCSLKLLILYDSVSAIQVDFNDGKADIYFTLRHPPLIFGLDGGGEQKNQQRRFVRLNKFFSCDMENFGKCKVIKMTKSVAKCIVFKKFFWKFLLRMKKRCWNAKIFFGAVQTISVDNLVREDFAKREISDWPFWCQYYWLALGSRHHSIVYQLTNHFFDEVSRCLTENPRSIEVAFIQLLCIIDNNSQLIVNVRQRFRQVYDKQCSLTDNDYSIELDLAAPYVSVRKVVITPTRVLLSVPDKMMSNRILRQFGSDLALRVIFRDEAGTRILASKFSLTSLKQIVTKVMTTGLTIGPRLYQFLGWSNSQLRDHGCYFYASTEEVNVEEIRRWMGDFSSIRSVPKLMSRMGQCFTQAFAITAIPFSADSKEVLIETDIQSSDSKFCFSDGIGRMSTKLAEEVAERLELWPVPSAFQIRYAGFKGMLCVDPRLDGDVKMVFRQSMHKFHTEGTHTLEIVKHSQPCEVNLNRPLIMILDQVAFKEGFPVNGRVQNRVMQLLDQQICELSQMLLFEDQAKSVLSATLSSEMNFEKLADAGFRFTEEPFFRNMLLACYKFKVKERLFRMKIEIDPSLGRTMYGVMDELGLLHPGQVFIQCSASILRPGEDKRVITGKVMVTKSPSVVPGDVRILTAVDLEIYHYLNDVIVFPKIGYRPVTDQMAGSDLDGDEYAVIWDEELMFGNNYPAMLYEKVISSEIDGDITSDKMVDFFLHYMCSDSIGRIAIAHLVASDSYGIFDDISNCIARKHSMAVDFPKSGVTPPKLENDEIPFKYPDYIPKCYNSLYMSKWLLGSLYRKVSMLNSIAELSLARKVTTSKSDPHLKIAEAKNFEEKARAIFQRYKSELHSLLDEYGIENEFQLITGKITKMHNRLSDGEQDDFSYYNTEKILKVRLGMLQKKYKKLFVSQFSSVASKEQLANCSEVQAAASAWYSVAYRDAEISNRTALSFPWLVWEVLLDLKLKNCPSERMDPVVVNLQNSIEAQRMNNEQLMEIIDRIFENSKLNFENRQHFENVQRILYTLFNWCDSVGLFAKSGGSTDVVNVVGQLFVDFVVFFEKSIENEMALLELNDTNTRSNGSISDHYCARVLLKFLEHCVNRRFDFSPHGQQFSKSPEANILYRSAFKQYHGMAVSGNFRGLFPGDGVNEETDILLSDVREMEPMMLNLSRETLTFLKFGAIVAMLKKWSKCEEVAFRSVNIERDHDDRFLISAYGTLQARRRLQNILLSNQIEQWFKSGECNYDVDEIAWL